QQVFAAHNLADLVLVSFADIPVSGANAFEEPVKRKGGFIKPSIQAFEKYMEQVRSGYNLHESHAAFSLWETAFEPAVKSLDALKAWVQADGKAL
ncbi:MAG: type I-E CRISPR-associated protein Cas7/Cse4/CasC, partial [Candidatus Sericytochromatia bacterium]